MTSSSSAKLHLHDPVSITNSTTSNDQENNEQLQGIIAHLGPVRFDSELDWVGIKLTGPSIGKGENNGSVDGVFYFDAGGERNGLFVKSVNVSRMEASNETTVGSSFASRPVDDGKSNQVSSENSFNVDSNPDSVTWPYLAEKNYIQSNSASSSASSAVRPLSGVSTSDEETQAAASAAAAASRENFLRRLELQQKQKQSNGIEISEGKKSKVKRVFFVGVADSAESHFLEDKEARKEAKLEKDAKQKPSLLAKDNTMQYEGDDLVSWSGRKDVLQPTSHIPRGNPHDDMTTVMSYLSRQRNLTHDQSSLDWIQDVDASSLAFLKGLATGNAPGAVVADEFSSSLFSNPATSSQPSDSVSPFSSFGGAPLSTTQEEILTEGSFQRASDEVMKGRKIVKVTSQQLSTEDRPAQSVDVTSTSTCPEQTTPIEHRMLTMMERQHHHIQELQAQLDALGNMLSQVRNDVRYLCETQRRRDQEEGRMTGNVGGYTEFNRNERPGRIPPPPPPLPPTHQGEQAKATTVVTHAPPNPQPAAMGRPGGGLPIHRGLLFPLATYIVECIVSFVRNFRSILLSTGPGRVYAHIREEAIRRRAFANVDIMSLMKLMVMLLVFSGRMGRDSDGNRNRRGGARRAQDNNNEGGEIVASFMQTALAFVRAHRVHVLVIAAMIGFLVQTGLMSFFYEVFWLEREELLRVWLGRRDQAEDGVDDDNEPEGVVRAVGLQQNINAELGGNHQAVPARGRAGPNANRVENILRRGRDYRQANVNHRAGGMIRRAPDGGFFHDIQCLIFSFFLSLIPAWKPEEAAHPPGIQQAQEEGPQGADETEEGEDAGEGVQ